LEEGVDYRGVPVVSVLSKIPGTSWSMVSKIDKAEIYAPINQLANWLAVMMLALIGTGGGIAVFWLNKERKQYQSELDHQRLTKHLDYLVKYANDIILLLDSAGKIADFNDRALEAYGYSAEEFSGLNIDDLRAIDFTPPSAERFRQIDQSGGALVFESTHIRRNGANFPVEASVRQIDIAGEKFYQAIIRDITERKLAESELARQKKFIRQVIDSNPNLIFVKDAGGRFLLANEAMAKSYGQTTEGIVGKYNYELVQNPEQAAAYDRANREVFEKRQEVVAIETGTLADGKNHWFKIIKKPLEQDDGSVSVLTIAMDITELKEAEEKQQKLNRALRLLSSCNAALAHAKEEAQLTEVCKLIVEMGGYRMAWVGYAEDDQERTVRPAMQYGFEEGYLEGVAISWADTERGRSPIGIAIRSGVTQVNQNPLIEPWREAALARNYQSSIALPLTSGARTFGVLAIYSATPDSFNSDEVILLQELADNLALGITALRLHTEHEHAIERLRQSEEHFRFLTENATDLIYIMSLPDGRYDYVSPSSAHLTGYTQIDFYSAPRLMQTIAHPDWHDYCEEQREKLLEGKVAAHFEFQIIHKSGETRWVHQRNVPIWSEDGSKSLIAIQGVVTDITEQKHAAEQRQQQKTFLQQIIDTDPNLIYVKDAAGNFLMVNQALADLYGMAMQKMIGKREGEIIQDQEEISGYLKSGHETFRDGDAVVSTEAILMPDDKQHWYLTIKKPLIQPDGSVSVLGIAVDITAQKRSEIKLAQSYRKLQQLYLHLENIRAEERAKIALNLHDEMGATLAAIKMSIAWLASKLPAGMPQLAAEVAHLTKLVSAGIQTMRHTVTQLNPARLDDIGLMAAIRDYVKKFQQHTKIECLLTLPNEELALEANQSATIFRIIQESLNNVVKHAQASEVHILLKKRGKSLLLTVEDNGIGLNSDERKKQTFGLLGIRERALMVGGKARIKSQQGKGTQVSASIPLSAGSNPLDTA
jgi:PAS domain S-box-containing protein